MAEKTRKTDRPREAPRNLPSTDATRGTEAQLLEAGPFEETCFTGFDLSNRKLSELKGSNLLFERVSFANCEIA